MKRSNTNSRKVVYFKSKYLYETKKGRLEICVVRLDSENERPCYKLVCETRGLRLSGCVLHRIILMAFKETYVRLEFYRHEPYV